MLLLLSGYRPLPPPPPPIFAPTGSGEVLAYPAPLPRKRRGGFRFPAIHVLGAKRAVARPQDLTSDPLQMLIHGVKVGSKEEFYVGTALDILGYRYGYQVPVNFGRKRRGGQVLDFLVYTAVRHTVVDVLGRFWHTGKHEDSLSMERVVKQHNWSYVAAWTDKVPSIAAAVSFLRFQLG